MLSVLASNIIRVLAIYLRNVLFRSFANKPYLYLVLVGPKFEHGMGWEMIVSLLYGSIIYYYVVNDNIESNATVYASCACTLIEYVCQNKLYSFE